MNITTAITSGLITVQVSMADLISTTIVILPNTAPGSITAQIPLQPAGVSFCGSQPPSSRLRTQ
jgi:hypothetical protein